MSLSPLRRILRSLARKSITGNRLTAAGLKSQRLTDSWNILTTKNSFDAQCHLSQILRIDRDRAKLSNATLNATGLAKLFATEENSPSFTARFAFTNRAAGPRP